MSGYDIIGGIYVQGVDSGTQGIENYYRTDLSLGMMP